MSLSLFRFYFLESQPETVLVSVANGSVVVVYNHEFWIVDYTHAPFKCPHKLPARYNRVVVFLNGRDAMELHCNLKLFEINNPKPKKSSAAVDPFLLVPEFELVMFDTTNYHKSKHQAIKDLLISTYIFANRRTY